MPSVPKVAVIPLYLLFALSLACSHPAFMRVPGLRSLYRPWGTPYLSNPRFSFVIKRDWLGPELITGGVRYSEKNENASVEVVFYPKGTPQWKEPVAFRQFMREQGTVGDSHVLQEVSISSRLASVVGFTSYHYDPKYLLGEKVDLLWIRLIMIEDPEGIYLIRMQMPKAHFNAYERNVFRRFLDSINLAEPKKRE